MVNDWHCHVSIYDIVRVKRKVLEKINEKHVDQFGKVMEYGNELLKVMSNSTIIVMTDDNKIIDERKRFKRFYIYLGPL